MFMNLIISFQTIFWVVLNIKPIISLFPENLNIDGDSSLKLVSQLDVFRIGTSRQRAFLKLSVMIEV